MSNLSANDLEYIRAALEETLPQECNILSPTYVSDGAGGQTPTWGTAYASVKCRLDSSSRGSEADIRGALLPYHTYILTLPWDTTIGETNRVEIGARTYTVSGVDLGKGWPGVIRVGLEAL